VPCRNPAQGLTCCFTLELFRASGDRARELGYRRGEANALDSLGEAYLRLGRTADAVSCFQESLSVLCELGDQYSQAEILTHLAAARQVEGDTPAARVCLQHALAILTELRHHDAAQVRAKLRDLDAGPAVEQPA